jgi:phosphate transport system substrate-binding protein
MKKFASHLVLSLVLFSLGVTTAALADSRMTIVGAGATFPYPLYAKWAENYSKETRVALNYQPIGSGGGIKQIEAGTVDFGASDKPLSLNELNKNQLVQFPAIIGGVVPIVNLDGIQSAQIKLSGSVLARIYLGTVKKWNEAEIKALNPTISLPNLPITVVHRSDGSGTTFLFADYLSKVSGAWKKEVGADTALSWPAGIGGKGNEGVAAYVQRVKGGIGYVEYAYAEQNKLAYIQLINHSGKAVSPSIQTFEAASVNAHWNAATQFSEVLTDTPGADSWPVVGASFILMRHTQDDPEKAMAMLKFFDWAYRNGKTIATQMDYVPLSDQLAKAVYAHWKANIKDRNGHAIWQ